MGKGLRDHRHKAAAPKRDPSSLPLPNYATARDILLKKFTEFLTHVAEKGELSWYHDLLSKSCDSRHTLKVSYHQMCEYNDVDLLVETCNMPREKRQFVFRTPAHQFLRQFQKDKASENAERINETYLSFSDFPTSIRKFEDCLKDDLVKRVPVFNGNLTILTPTSHGRLLIAMLVVTLLENYSQSISWGGALNMANIVIVNYGCDSAQMKILQKPVGSTERRREDMVNELKKVAGSIIQWYNKRYNALPLYFSQLKADLDGVTSELLEQKWFRVYLSYHVAFMPASARRSLEILLYDICQNCNIGYRPFLLAKSNVHPVDWKRKLMNFPISDVCDAFKRVYYHHNLTHQVATEQYDDSVSSLMKFKCNFLKHGGQVVRVQCMAHLELCAAHVLSEFLPSLLRTLLEGGLTGTVFEEAWEDFKASRWAKSDSWSCGPTE